MNTVKISLPVEHNPATFDDLLNSIPPGTVIQLAPGIYRTHGRVEGGYCGFIPKPGWKIVGESPETTAIQLVIHDSVPADRMVAIFLSHYNEAANGFLLENVTLDLDGSNAEHFGHALGGVCLRGSDMTVRHCRAIDWGNHSSLTESWVFSLNAALQPLNALLKVSSHKNTIEHCVADLPSMYQAKGNTTVFHSGGQRTANHIGVSITPTIRYCRCEMPELKADQYVVGLSMGGAVGGIVEGNVMVNVAKGGPYQDTGDCDSLAVVNNTYMNCITGPMLNVVQGNIVRNGYVVRSMAVDGNRFYMPMAVGSSVPTGLYIHTPMDGTPGHVSVDELVVRDNLFVFIPTDLLYSMPNLDPVKTRAMMLHGCRSVIMMDNVVALPGSTNPGVGVSKCTKTTVMNHIGSIFDYSTNTWIQK